MGPHSGLSLRGGTGYPAPHWNLELEAYSAMHNAYLQIESYRCQRLICINFASW